MTKEKFDEYQYDELSKQVWEDNYKSSSENNREQTWKRTAKACVEMEKEDIKEKIEEEFLSIIYNDKFVPGGRILANLGIPDKINVTQYNCFVHNPRDIDLKDCDSIDGIYDLLKAQAKTLRSEGGYGINASFIRPAGTYIAGIGARTPGVLKFMELWDKSSEILTMGSVNILGGKKEGEKSKIRKGAQMLVLDIWHPEIKDFIIAKQTPGRLTKFNTSVGVTKGFMETLISDGNWELKFPDTEHPKYKTEWFGDIEEWETKGLPVIVYENIKAKEIWDSILRSTYNRNEPGILFLDTANKLNPVYWFDFIKTTNPCFGGDTLIAVADGRNAVTIKQLVEEGKDVPVYSVNKETGEVSIKIGRNPRITGYDKKLLKITLDDGSSLNVTPNHKFFLKDGKIVEAKDLKYGDSLPRFFKKPTKISKQSKHYYSIKTNTKKSKTIFEHRLIAEHCYKDEWDKAHYEEQKNGWHKGGLVVHHIDYDALNNKPENLKIMTFKDHQQFHAEHDCAGEKNGRFYGKSSEEIKKYALELTKKLGRRFSRIEWKKYAEENNLPKTFSKMHTSILGKNCVSLAKICAIELGLDTEIDLRCLPTLKTILEQGYSAFIKDNTVYIEKICEGCNKKFNKQHNKREIAFCSYECYQKNGMNNFFEQKAEKTKEAQARIWSQLYFNFKRKPQKIEWVEVCKKEKIPVRLGGTKNGFNFYKEVIQAGQNYNHKVVSVEELEGKHTVYNLTVDVNHTLAVITSQKNIDENKKNIVYSGIFTANCGEVPMSTGVCNLGSINLVSFIKKQLANDDLFFDYNDFAKTVKVAIRFLDNINDISPTPLPEYKKSVLEKRRIGCGVMGLGSIHLMLAIRYGSKDSLKLVENIFKTKSENELIASALLGKEKGSFEKFNKEKYFSSIWWKNLKISSEIKKEVEDIGEMRNSHQSMNAPTGNTGIYARNVSGGIEPVFDTNGYYRWSIVTEKNRRELIKLGFKFPDVNKKEWFETEHIKETTRGDEKILKGSFDDEEYEIDSNRGLTKRTFVEDYGLKFAKKYYLENFEKLRKDGIFASAQELTIKEHIDVLKIAAHYTNMSISKTVNVPEQYPYEDFKNLYLEAWKNNLKGITTYRAGTMTAVLETTSNNENKESKDIIAKKLTENHAPKRPKELPCDIHIMTVKGEKWTFFVGKMDNKPYEILGGLSKYVNIPKRAKEGKIIKHNGLSNPVARYDLHYDYDKGPEDETTLKDIVNIFENTTEAAFTRTLSLSLRHGVPMQYIVEQVTKGSEKDNDLFGFSKAVSRVLKTYIVDGTKSNKKCLKCSSDQLSYQEGCLLCVSCGFSKC